MGFTGLATDAVYRFGCPESIAASNAHVDRTSALTPTCPSEVSCEPWGVQSTSGPLFQTSSTTPRLEAGAVRVQHHRERKMHVGTYRDWRRSLRTRARGGREVDRRCRSTHVWGLGQRLRQLRRVSWRERRRVELGAGDPACRRRLSHSQSPRVCVSPREGERGRESAQHPRQHTAHGTDGKRRAKPTQGTRAMPLLPALKAGKAKRGEKGTSEQEKGAPREVEARQKKTKKRRGPTYPRQCSGCTAAGSPGTAAPTAGRGCRRCTETSRTPSAWHR